MMIQYYFKLFPNLPFISGVFVTHGDIGVGTILGSAVFNVLFVIGVCGIGAGTVRSVLYFLTTTCQLQWTTFLSDHSTNVTIGHF